MFENVDIKEISPYDYPLSENFCIKIEDSGTFGKKLHFEDKEKGLYTSFPWWDYVDNSIKKYKEKDIPLGDFENPYIDLEQCWQVCIFKKEDYVYILEGSKPGEDLYYSWYKVNYEKYINEWLKIIKLCAEICVSFKSLDEALSFDQSKVKELILNYKGFNEFPREILNFKNLEKLKFMGDSIGEVPTDIKELENLKVLALSGCSIKSLPGEIRNLTNLKELYLNNNRFSKFPEEILPLKKLELIDLCGNSKIESIPQSIAELKGLKDIWINDTGLKALPENLGDLKNLVLLSVSDCNLKSLPESICKLKNLKTLYCTHTNLNKLPEKIGELNSIKVFQVSSNSLPKDEKIRGKIVLKKAFID